jgi:hypothetical protein
MPCWGVTQHTLVAAVKMQLGRFLPLKLPSQVMFMLSCLLRQALTIPVPPNTDGSGDVRSPEALPPTPQVTPRILMFASTRVLHTAIRRVFRAQRGWPR